MDSGDPSSVGSVLINLSSGVIGAGIASWVAWLVQRATRRWTLEAELKRYRINRITGSVQSLRACFYRALSAMDFHHADLLEEEETRRRPFAMVELARQLLGDAAVPERVVAEVERLVQNNEMERLRYNASQSLIQAEAQSSVAVLAACDIPSATLAAIQQQLLILAEGRTSDAASVLAKINHYKANEPIIMQRLREAEVYAEGLILAEDEQRK